METKTYEQMVKESPEVAMRAELHEICEWLETILAWENGQINDRSLVTSEVIEKLKHHDLWVK